MWCCDRSEEALELPKRRYPQVSRTTDFHDVLNDDSVEALVIATPTATHAELAIAALEAGSMCWWRSRWLHRRMRSTSSMRPAPIES